MIDKTLALEDLYLKIFVDTNIIISALEKKQPNPIKEFLIDISKHEHIQMYISDFVQWEILEYIRTEVIIKELIKEGLFSKNKDSYHIQKNPSLMKEIERELDNCLEEISKFTFSNYNCMDKECIDFFQSVEHAFRKTRISGKDILMLVSAIMCKCDYFLTCDGGFISESRRAKNLNELLKDSKYGISTLRFLTPDGFIKNNKGYSFAVNKMYRDWFKDTNEPKSIGRIINSFPKNNVIGIRCHENKIIKIGDYLKIIIFDENYNYDSIDFKVEKGNIKTYTTVKDTDFGNKITIKLPDHIYCSKIKCNQPLYKLDNYVKMD